VLVSDDNPQASVVVLGMLGSMGCAVRHAKNGEEAISFYKEISPDYVLMDIQMPIVNGLTAAREIRNFEKLNNLNRACILAVTGELKTADVLDGDVFSGFLQKPFSQSDLLSAISRAV
jgi:CheY-like chemotaxis protein